MTVFDFDAYPASGASTNNHKYPVSRELMEDGSPVVRQLGTAEYALSTVVFSPLTLSQSSSLLAFINQNRATEVDFGAFGVGYFWGEPSIQNVAGLTLRVITIPIYTRIQ